MIRKIIDRPLIVVLVAAMVALAGVVSAVMLPIKLQPNVSMPFLMVTAQAEQETGLDQMERELAVPLEAIALQSDIVKNTKVTVTTQNVRLEIMLSDAAKKDEINSLREEFNQRMNRSSLSLSSQDVRQFSTSDQVIMVAAITAEDQAQAARMRTELKEKLLPALQEVAGISRIDHTFDRYVDQYILEFIPDQVDNVQQAAQIIDEIQSQFRGPLLGSLEVDGSTYSVQTKANVTTRSELMSLELSSGQALSEVVNISTRQAADNYFMRINGKPYEEVSIYATASSSEVKISNEVRQVFADKADEQQVDWDYVFAWDAADFIGGAISELVRNIVIGALVASLLLLAVFRSFRTMLVVGLSMPICICATLVSMFVFGYSINIITLLGIGLGTGMIVDACIVVIENIFRHLQEGRSRREAIAEGTKEVIAPVTASVLTTVAVFIPITFLDGMIGSFMKELALTITVALLTSLIVAITLIPVLSVKLMKTGRPIHQEGRLIQGYEKVLRYVLRRRWRMLLSFLLVLILAIYSVVALVPKNYIPNVSDRSLFIRYNMAEDTDYQETWNSMDETAEALLAMDGVQDVIYWGNQNSPTRATLIMLYDPAEEMNRPDAKVDEEIQDWIEENVSYASLNLNAGQADTSGEMSIAVTASSMSSILAAIPEVQEDIEAIEHVSGTEAELIENSRRWVIDFSSAALAEQAMTRQEVEQYLRLMLNGVPEMEVTIDGTPTTVAIRFPEKLRQTDDVLFEIPLRQQSGVTVNDVAELTQEESEARRVRQDGRYELIMKVYFDSDQRDQVVQEVRDFVERYSSPLIELDLAGTQQQQDEAFQKLLLAVAVAFAAVFLILTVQFNRLRQPFLIMLSLPFAMIGVSIGFLATGRTFDVVAMIGIVMLVGIVVNNAIVLIDFINKQRPHHEHVADAVIAGAKLRLRPIFTTTFTTVGGLIPMFIGGSASSDFQTPLATSVIFGLLFSTLVSLVVVPILYTLFERKLKR